MTNDLVPFESLDVGDKFRSDGKQYPSSWICTKKGTYTNGVSDWNADAHGHRYNFNPTDMVTKIEE